ncbi:MAG: phosphotriesterase-related protein [Candidatus Hydrogenedentota bacterium]|nr:MAG: phosphotriesterase-related protein [Candidatus Hydrogenedentota bacterium]
MMSRQVQTATGPVDAGRLGFTLGHEHVLIGAGGLKENFPFLFDHVRTRERIVRELKEAKAGGIDTIIDLTTMDLGRDVELFAEVSRASGVHIVVTTGLWLSIPIIFRECDPNFFAGIFVHEIEHGIASTRIKPGVIKASNDVEGVTPEGEAVLRGAARACMATGVPISTHQWAPERVGARQVEIFREEGVDMSRVCIGHSADTTDIEYLTGLLEKGVYLSMDRYPGREERPDWRARNATVKALVDRGFADRLMLGHDYAPGPVFAGEGPAEEAGPTTYLFLSRTAIPALRRMGVSEDAIHAMTVEAPRRFLCGGD